MNGIEPLSGGFKGAVIGFGSTDSEFNWFSGGGHGDGWGWYEGKSWLSSDGSRGGWSRGSRKGEAG